MIAARHALLVLLGTFLFFIFSPIHLTRLCWQRYILNQNVTISPDAARQAYATVLTSVDEALATLLPGASHIEKEIKALSEEQMNAIAAKAKLNLHPQYDKTYEFFVARTDQNISGYAAQDMVRGKWGPIYYMAAFHPDGRVKDVIVLAYDEQRGKPVAKRRFLKQFRNKTTAHKIRLMKDIRGITGASISSRGMADGIRKMTHVFEAFYVAS